MSLASVQVLSVAVAPHNRLILLALVVPPRWEDALEASEAWAMAEGSIDITRGQLPSVLPPSAFYKASPEGWEAKFTVAYRTPAAAVVGGGRRRLLARAAAPARPASASPTAAVAAAAGQTCKGLSLREPLPDCLTKIASPFGEQLHPTTNEWHAHTGIDITCVHGEAVRAAHDGLLVVKSDPAGYGYHAIVSGGPGE